MADVDMIIKGGRLISPSDGIDQEGCIALKGRRIVPYAAGMEAKTVIRADGCLVTPGLIDCHAHIYDRGTDSGANPDLAMLPYGVTTVADAGSSGVSTYRSFLDRLNRCYIKSYFFLHVSPAGQVTHQYPETLLPSTWNLEKFKEALEIGGKRVLGLKVRVSKNVVHENGLEPLRQALLLAEELGTRLVVHVTDPPASQGEIAGLLRPGDIFCHVYHQRGNTIIENGHVMDQVWDAKKRGVLFDCCHGSINFSYQVAERAIEEGFLPDIISSDLNTVTWCKPPLYNLTCVMSKLLMLGMPLASVVEAVTKTPANVIGAGNELGTLREGSCADIAILKLREGVFPLADTMGEIRTLKQMFWPVATILDGSLVYRSQDLCFDTKNG